MTPKEDKAYFEKDGSIDAGTTNPKTILHIKGALASSTRIGTYKLDKIPADGQWHPIITHLKGSCAFEILAYAGKEKSGKHALLHATALCTFGKSKPKIRKTQAHYGWFWNKLNMRWVGDSYNYSLELKTGSHYGSAISIKYHITKLWDDSMISLFEEDS